MSTCRRRLLDKALEDATAVMRGRVLDIGGKKDNKRGRFRPPFDKVSTWEYVNISADSNPDYCCDAASIPLEDGCIDTVVITEVLEYLKEPEKVLAEIYRLLTEQGTCVVSVPFLHPVHGDWELDRQRWTEVKLEQTCRKAGFKKIEIEPMGSIWSVLHDIFHVWLGYARSDPNRFYLKVLRKMLHTTTPFCLWLDSFTQNDKYINSGYFIILKK